MAYSLTDDLKNNRFVVVEVDAAAGRLRVKGEAEACSDFTCDGTVVITDEGRGRDLGAINAGDIITLEEEAGRAQQVRVVRRVYEEHSSPEW
jgi:hypothetical protein